MAELKDLQGRTIAVVYSFQGENAPGFSHYHFWESDIIAKWLEAIQHLRCRPFIIDVKTFMEKAIADTLPHIDFVLNLNCGGIELSPMALVPSICSFRRIPCIPCDSVSVLTGENKQISNLIANAVGLQVPKTLDSNASHGIFRPLNLGSSIGVKIGKLNGDEPAGTFQEFIPGYDITTPIVYNPIIDSFDFMPTVLYIPDENNTQWILNDKVKETRQGFQRKTISSLNDNLKEKYLCLIKSMSINSFCRIDARIRCNSEKELIQICSKPLQLSDVYFVEINTMPTVWINNAFSHSFSSVNKDSTIHAYKQELSKIFPQATMLHDFLLSLSMLEYYNHVQK